MDVTGQPVTAPATSSSLVEPPRRSVMVVPVATASPSAPSNSGPTAMMGPPASMIALNVAAKLGRRDFDDSAKCRLRTSPASFAEVRVAVAPGFSQARRSPAHRAQLHASPKHRRHRQHPRAISSPKVSASRHTSSPSVRATQRPAHLERSSVRAISRRLLVGSRAIDDQEP